MVVSHPRGGHGHRLFSLKFTIIFILVFILLPLVEFIIIAFGIKYFLVAYVLLYQFLFKPYRRYRIPSGPKCFRIFPYRPFLRPLGINTIGSFVFKLKDVDSAVHNADEF
jgi:hypothetical protein